jgi:hypothetical protein
LVDQGKQRAGEGDETVDPAAFQHILAHSEEHLGGEIDVNDAIVAPEHQHGMRERVKQRIGGDWQCAADGCYDFTVCAVQICEAAAWFRDNFAQNLIT